MRMIVRMVSTTRVFKKQEQSSLAKSACQRKEQLMKLGASYRKMRESVPARDRASYPHGAKCASQCLSGTGLCKSLGHMDVILPDVISNILMLYF